MVSQSHKKTNAQTDELTSVQWFARETFKRLEKSIQEAQHDHKVELEFHPNGTATVTLWLVGIDTFAAVHLESELEIAGTEDGWEIATWMCRGDFASADDPHIVTQKVFA